MASKTIVLFISFVNIVLLTEGNPSAHRYQETESNYAKECIDDDDCGYWDKCVEGVCLKVCDNNCLGDHEECFPDNHKALCQCILGFSRNENGICEADIPCDTNSNCEDYQTCTSHGCTDPCSIHHCNSSNEICIADNHVASCTCLHGYQRLEHVCKKECSRHSDCDEHEVCKQFENDTYICQCKSNYSHDNNYQGQCQPKCMTKDGCPADHWCKNDLCVKCNRASCPLHYAK